MATCPFHIDEHRWIPSNSAIFWSWLAVATIPHASCVFDILVWVFKIAIGCGIGTQLLGREGSAVSCLGYSIHRMTKRGTRTVAR